MAITLNGTAGITNVNGTAAAPAITGTDTDSGMYFGTNTVGISTNGTAAVSIDASQNVTLNNVIPSGATAPTNGMYLPAANIVGFATNSTERVRIDSSGNLLVGTATSGGAGGTTIFPLGNGAGSTAIQVFNKTNTATDPAIQFRVAGTTVNAISYTSTLITYGTTSDYRLKEDVQPMTGALEKVAQLKPVTYKWKIDGSNGEGFIAHELADVCPYAVAGEKDALDKDGNINPQGVDTSFLVATLTAAIQEQQTLITSLTDRIAALEAR